MDNTIVTILLSATGGALISAGTGFLSEHLKRKHSFKMLKEEDRYEYIKEKERWLSEFLTELEREYVFVHAKDIHETINHAGKMRSGMITVYKLAVSFLKESDAIQLKSLFEVEGKHCTEFYDKVWCSQRREGELDINEASEWFNSLSLFRNELSEAIQAELISIRKFRTE